MRAWRRIFQAYFLKNDARLVVLMTMVLAFTLDTNDVVAEAGGAREANMIVKGSLKSASPKVLEGARFRSSCAGTDSEHPIVARCRRTTTCDM